MKVRRFVRTDVVKESKIIHKYNIEVDPKTCMETN